MKKKSIIKGIKLAEGKNIFKKRDFRGCRKKVEPSG